MKFGVEFNSKIIESWREYYLQYNQLNAQLKEPISPNFERNLELELKKVFGFVQVQLDQLTHRVDACGSTLKDYRSTASVDKGAYDFVADQLADVLVDVDQLSKFHELNLSAFQRLVAKYQPVADSRSIRRLLETYPLDKQRFDVLMVQISEHHDLCQRHGHPRSPCDTTEGQMAFERATNKYWVHPDHINEVKAILLLHLPIHLFNQTKQYEFKDAAVSSVYFDNDQFDLYHERLERLKGAEAIRVRWYGQSENDDDVYVERKTHRAPWLEERSVKDRFQLQEAHINGFISGAYSIHQHRRDMENKNNNNNRGGDSSVESSCLVAEGIQRSIQQRQLKPVCRVFYHRTAFQFPSDPRLRISLDANLTFIREDHLDGIRRRKKTKTNQDNWRRPDVDIDFPFRHVNERDMVRFPYAVLETKIQSHLGQTIPAWLHQLLESHLVHEVPHFSKYLHGASQLFGERVPKVPYWLPELQRDIRKPATPHVGLSRSKSAKPLFNGRHRRSLEAKREPVPHLSLNFYDHPVPPVTNEHTPNNPYPKYFINSKVPDDKPHKSSPLTPGDYLGNTPLNKRKHLLMKKSDPKSFFANERTFISWLQFCALMLTVSLNLLNYGDRISRIVGACFIVVSSAIAMYALARFQLRSYYMRTGRSASNMEDIYGPVLLCILLVGALSVNFYLRAPLIFSSVASDPSTTQPLNQF